MRQGQESEDFYFSTDKTLCDFKKSNFKLCPWREYPFIEVRNIFELIIFYCITK
jgi:hypothetical protein